MSQLVSFCIAITAAMAVIHSVSLNAHAQSSISTPKPASPEKEKLFTLTTKLSTFTNLEETESKADETASLLEIKPSIRIASDLNALANVGIEFDHVTDESKLLNIQILLVKDPIQLNPDWSLNLALQGFLPTDEEAHDEATFRTAGGGIVGINRAFSLFSKDANVSYALNGLKNAHKFDRDNLRSANISHRLRQSAALTLALNKKLTLEVGGYFQTGWTYQKVVKESYTFSQGLSYQVDSQLALGIEHGTGGRFFAADGSEWDATLYDARKSEVGVSVTGTF